MKVILSSPDASRRRAILPVQRLGGWIGTPFTL
jgi:hypothetical protein